MPDYFSPVRYDFNQWRPVRIPSLEGHSYVSSALPILAYAVRSQAPYAVHRTVMQRRPCGRRCYASPLFPGSILHGYQLRRRRRRLALHRNWLVTTLPSLRLVCLGLWQQHDRSTVFVPVPSCLCTSLSGYVYNTNRLRVHLFVRSFIRSFAWDHVVQKCFFYRRSQESSSRWAAALSRRQLFVRLAK